MHMADTLQIELNNSRHLIFGILLKIVKSKQHKYKFSLRGCGLRHVTLIKFGTPSNISPKRAKLQTSNLAYGCIWTISPKWRNKNIENGRGLGHVILRKFGTP